LIVGEDALAELQEALAGGRQPHAPSEPDEQRLLQFLLEQQHLTADR
jgi:hypothetical protein